MELSPDAVEAAVLLQLSTRALAAYRAGDAEAPLRAGHLAERAERVLTGFLHPELAPVRRSTAAATALAWFALDCADDEHLACWLRRQLTDLGVEGDGTEGYAAPVATFRHDRTDYSWVRLTELPPPHNPFRCDSFDDFGRLLRAEHRWAKLRVLGRRRSDAELRRRAGERFRRRCPDRLGCRWHDENQPWAKALPFARQVQQQATSWTAHAVRQAVEAEVPEELRPAVASLFFDPIVWSPGEPQVDNGQHRILALYAAGVAEVLVATR